MIGILNSKVMDDKGIMIVRIDEKSYEVLPYVLPFLQKIEMGARVEATIKDDKITKIARIKPPTTQMKPMGFHEAEEAMEKKELPSPPFGVLMHYPSQCYPIHSQIEGSVKIAVHIDLGSYSNFDLEVNGATGEQARALLEQESKPVIMLCKKIMRDAKEDGA